MLEQGSRNQMLLTGMECQKMTLPYTEKRKTTHIWMIGYLATGTSHYMHRILEINRSLKKRGLWVVIICEVFVTQSTDVELLCEASLSSHPIAKPHFSGGWEMVWLDRLVWSVIEWVKALGIIRGTQSINPNSAFAVDKQTYAKRQDIWSRNWGWERRIHVDKSVVVLNFFLWSWRWSCEPNLTALSQWLAAVCTDSWQHLYDSSCCYYLQNSLSGVTSGGLKMALLIRMWLCLRCLRVFLEVSPALVFFQ